MQIFAELRTFMFWYILSLNIYKSRNSLIWQDNTAYYVFFKLKLSKMFTRQCLKRFLTSCDILRGYNFFHHPLGTYSATKILLDIKHTPSCLQWVKIANFWFFLWFSKYDLECLLCVSASAGIFFLKMRTSLIFIIDNRDKIHDKIRFQC